MIANELFRLVSLRQSTRPSAAEGSSRSGATPAGGRSRRSDPRLRHRDLIANQRDVTVAERDARLAELKTAHAALSQKVRDSEAIERAVVNVTMQEAKDVSALPRTAAARRREGEMGTAAGRLGRAVEARLSAPQKALYRDVVKSLGDRPGFGEIITNIDISPIIDLANRYCAEIRAIEDDLADGLPTVAAGSAAELRAITPTVGWGELIVAREELVGYTAREIAHIENIMPGEKKVREHERTTASEETTETETITEKETEKDSQSTDRYELQAETQETISRDFSVSAGVNTSGKYGVTQIDVSLDTAFSQSSSQSRNNTMTTAKEVVNKAVERTFERVRKLRRLTVSEEIREINYHELTNMAAGGTAPATDLSGIYMWVEKIQRVELRHYGTRMMLEFHIPEPAVSLLERTTAPKPKKRLPPFDLSPANVDVTNYMCLAQRYGAYDVEPPPAQYISVGWGWASVENEDDEQWAEDQFTAMINVPDGYKPVWAKVAWSGLEGSGNEFNFAFSIAGRSQNQDHRVPTFDGVAFDLPWEGSWPNGVPVSGRVHGHWDSCMYVQANLKCIRTGEAYDNWRLRTWEALRSGYELLERKLATEDAAEEGRAITAAPFAGDRPPAENRRIERGELQKWAIKAMRTVPQNFNAIENVDGQQELSPVYAEAQAPIVRFFEDAFEWEHMTYFLYPYHWARRASWKLHTGARSTDPQFQSFLEAGAARLIVPVTPGFEAKVVAYVDDKAGSDELTRILTPPPSTPPNSGGIFDDVWVELLIDRGRDVARGSGTVKLEAGSTTVTINNDSKWDADSDDVGRELFLHGDVYVIKEVATAKSVTLDRPYGGDDENAAIYATGSTPYGPPWTVNVPTTLVVLAGNKPTLEQLL
jgi:hypothetical protein